MPLLSAFAAFAADLRLEDLDPYSFTETKHVFRPRAKKSVRETPLNVGGITYENGLGLKAEDVPVWGEFFPNGGAKSFEVVFGVDALAGSDSKAVLNVYGDERLLATSGEVSYGEAAKSVKVGLGGVKVVKLEVTDAGSRAASAYVDLYQVLFGTRTDSVVAERWIVCDRPQNVRFRIGTEAYSATQDFVVTLNGEEVWRGAMPRGTKRLEPDASLSLREGVNELSVRVGHREWQRQFTFELVGEDGGDPASLRYCWRPAR